MRIYCNRWRMCCTHTAIIWLPKQMCTQTHTRGTTSFKSHQQKLAMKQMRTNTRNHCKRGASHPCEHPASEWTGGVLYIQNLVCPNMKHGALGRERATEVESEGKRGGADGSAIWWMEQEQERWKRRGRACQRNVCVYVRGDLWEIYMSEWNRSVCGLFEWDSLCVQQGCSAETQVPADSPVELLWHVIENTHTLTHSCISFTSEDINLHSFPGDFLLP